MRTIRLMADYDSWPLWEASPGFVGNINPYDIPISDALRQDLENWANEYDKTLNRADPLNSGFSSESEELEFKKTGDELLVRLQSELNGVLNVIGQEI